MGGLFVLAQVGADYGYITIDHEKIKKDVEKKLDINQGITLVLYLVDATTIICNI